MPTEKAEAFIAFLDTSGEQDGRSVASPIAQASITNQALTSSLRAVSTKTPKISVKERLRGRPLIPSLDHVFGDA